MSFVWLVVLVIVIVIAFFLDLSFLVVVVVVFIVIVVVFRLGIHETHNNTSIYHGSNLDHDPPPPKIIAGCSL